MLRFLARFLAVVFAALFVCTTVAVVFLRPIGTQMLAPQTYKDVLREQRVAERLPELTADTIDRAVTAAGRKVEQSPGAATGDFAGWLQAVSTQDMQTLVGAVLPADYVNGQLDGVVDQFFAYVHSDVKTPSVKLALVDLKQRLSGGVLEDAYVKVLQGKPACAGDAATGLPVGCCPPAERLPDVRAQFREMIGPAVKEMPDSVDLFAARSSAQAEQVFRAMDGVRNKLRTFAAIARWSWVLPVLLLVGVAVFGVRSFRGLLLWWGIPCLLAGLCAAVFALPSAALAGWIFHHLIAPHLPPEVPVLAVDAVLGLVTAVAQVVLSAAWKMAAWIGLGGLVAVILSPLFKTKPKPPALG